MASRIQVNAAAPIALFTYTRPEHTRRTIEALKANYGAADSELFIFSDAAKDASATHAVAEVRAFLRSISGFKQVHLIERPTNLGLADSIIDGVTSIVKKYGTVIVLEDDIVTSPFFLQFMNRALALYAESPEVMHVSGYYHPVDPTGLPETFFYNQASCWGWATWDRAWDHFNSNVAELYESVKVIPNSHEYYKICMSQLRANLRGEIKTWAARWQASILIQKGLCLHPARSYVQNIGHDGTGVHSTSSTLFNNITLNESPTFEPIQHLQESSTAAVAADNFLRSLRPPLLKRLTAKMLRYAKK